MRHRNGETMSPGVQPAQLWPLYTRRRIRVDGAYRRMHAISTSAHTPADTRQAAAELEAALADAAAVAGQALRSELAAAPGTPHRRRAVRSVAPPVAAWAAELVRLAETGVWLRRTALDELGVHLPWTVRVGSRAATEPHIPGLVFEPDDLVAATIHEPRIGVPLQEIVDGVERKPDRDQPAVSPPPPSKAA